MNLRQIHQAGASLLELMVYTLLISVISATGSIVLSESLAKGRLLEFVNKTKLTLERLRTNAINTRCTMLVATSVEGFAYFSEASCFSDRDGELRVPRGIGIASSPSTIRFYASGVASPTTLTISSGTANCTISISLRGRVRSRCNE